VSQRACGRCEYCLIQEQDAAFAHEVDHVIGRQHGGSSEPDNLAFACLFCNRCKGTNVASIGAAGVLVRLYNPRADRWEAHFRLEGSVIQPLTPEGAATVRLLKLNAADE
jgi:5-methylcytosine-specific restriction endonuclease McrA